MSNLAAQIGSLYAAIAAMTFGFVSGRAKPKGKVEWLTLIALSAFWPLFLLWLMAGEHDG